MKDHIIAAVVNDLRDTAIKFHNTQQLRERLRGCIEPLLSAAAPVAAGSVDTPEFCALLEFYGRMYPQGDMARTAQAKAAIIGSIDAWGAQQRAMQQEENNGIMREWAQRVVSAEDRAEKAEAERYENHRLAMQYKREADNLWKRINNTDS